MTNILTWLALCLVAFLTGAFLLKYLTVHPLRMGLHLSLLWFALFAGLLLFLQPAVLARAWLGAGTCLLFFLAGYSLFTWRFLSREDSRPVPALTRQPGDPGLGHTAVVYFTHGEPETYDPIGWLNQFREFDQQKIAFVPFLARPFFAFILRRKYLQVGSSHHRQGHQKMLRSLEAAFRQEGDAETKFYLCFLDDNPRPDAAVILALNEGASRVIVAEVFVSVSNHTLEGKNLIAALGVEGLGVPIIYTGPLWDSSSLHSMFVRRANAARGETPRESTGVLLVGHGQPDEWDREFASETEHELRFRGAILDLLEADGYPRANLSLAWMEFKQPKPARVIEAMLAHGVEKVLYFSAAISADSIHSQADVPDLVAKAHLPRPDLPLLNLGAWNDDPLVIQAIKEKIEAAVGFHSIEARSEVLEETR